MSRYRIVQLTADELQRCVVFSNQSAKSQQQIEFGQSDTVPRSIKEIARDNLIGKMAELAVSKMLREDYGLHIPIDYEIYPRGEWDDCDISINGWNIDIKSTRNGRWLLFELHKLRIREPQGKLPHAIFMCKTPWNMEKDEPVGNVELIGMISLKKLVTDHKFVKLLKKGSFIPGTRARLQADNYGVKFEDLSADWKTNIDYIIAHTPPDLKTYPTPYK